MSQSSQDSLETLRQRATCPICRTFYIHPKKLSNCPHVFCLNCIKLHLLANSHLNFPNCPMCRKPMLKPRSEIDQYEPARAEEEVSNFVKQFEVCGVCNKPENPNLRCLNCNRFICTNCEPCHRMLKPSHNVESIISSDSWDRSKPNTSGSETCIKHPEEERIFLCVDCLKTVCIICKDHPQKYHRNCNVHNTPGRNCTLLKPYFNKDTQPLFFRVADISAAACEWLEKLYEDLKECVDFLQDYKTKSCEAKNTVKENFTCIEDIQQEAEHVVMMGEVLLAETENVLKLPADADTAIHVLKNEVRYQLFFQLRRTFPMKPYLIKADLYKTAGGNSFRQILKCTLHDVGYINTGMMIKEFQSKKVFDNYGIFDDNDTMRPSHHLSKRNSNIFMAILFPQCPAEETKKPNVKNVGATECLEENDTSTCLSKYFSLSAKCYYIQANSPLYTCDLLVQMEDTPVYENCDHVFKISDGYTFSGICCQYTTKNSNKTCIAVCSFLNCLEVKCKCCNDLKQSLLYTDFVNCFMQPFVSIQDDGQAHVFAFSGNRGPSCGLETVFVYCNGLQLPKAGSFVARYMNGIPMAYGICINTYIAKFRRICSFKKRQYIHAPHNLKLLDMYEKFTQTFYMSVDRKHAGSCYQTEITETYVPSDFLFCETERQTSRCRSSSMIPVKYIKLELLCGLNSELYFVNRDFKNNVVIGSLLFTQERTELRTIGLIEPKDIDISLSKLKPLTITKTSVGEIIVVCSVKEENSKFVMIRPTRGGADAIEYLEVSYPTEMISEDSVKDSVAYVKLLETSVEDNVDRVNINKASVESAKVGVGFKMPIMFTEAPEEIFGASVEELEMSPDGDIFYILKDKNGRCYCVTTKYLIRE